MSDDRAGAGEGPDADENGEAKDEGERASNVPPDDRNKVEKLTAAGRDKVDPSAGQE